MPHETRRRVPFPGPARAFAACLLGLLLAACGGGGHSTVAAGGTSSPASTPVAASTTLVGSVSELALSTVGLTEYGITGTPSSGLARSFTITNTGAAAASGITVVTVPALPSGTAMTTTCGSTLGAGASCTVTVTPGATATSDGTQPCTAGTTPLPAVVSVGGSNTDTVDTDVVVLGYGCIDQGGYVYAFDDTTPATASVGGKVLTTTDASTSILWSSDGSGNAAYDAIYAISELSTTTSPSPSTGQVVAQEACNGATDGACDSNNIYVYYENAASGAPIGSAQYAAGACKATFAGYSDWYLPAVCEMGYGSAACGTSGAPALQNVQSDLVDANGLNLLSGYYWSATEFSVSPMLFAWDQYFATSGSLQLNATKGNLLHARCSRAF